MSDSTDTQNKLQESIKKRATLFNFKYITRARETKNKITWWTSLIVPDKVLSIVSLGVNYTWQIVFTIQTDWHSNIIYNIYNNSGEEELSD